MMTKDANVETMLKFHYVKHSEGLMMYLHLLQDLFRLNSQNYSYIQEQFTFVCISMLTRYFK